MFTDLTIYQTANSQGLYFTFTFHSFSFTSVG